jgi:hypothetical protein
MCGSRLIERAPDPVKLLRDLLIFSGNASCAVGISLSIDKLHGRTLRKRFLIGCASLAATCTCRPLPVDSIAFPSFSFRNGRACIGSCQKTMLTNCEILPRIAHAGTSRIVNQPCVRLENKCRTYRCGRAHDLLDACSRVRGAASIATDTKG